MTARWLFVALGGPTLFGIILTIVIVGASYESPCACRNYGSATIGLEVDLYRRKLATFDRVHGEKMCPSSIEQLAALPPFELTKETFVLDCTIRGAPAVRRIHLRLPGWDRRLETNDDILYRLD